MDVSLSGDWGGLGNMIMEGTGSSPTRRRPRSTTASSTRATVHDRRRQTVTIADRKKDVIISGGENVSSIEVEDAIFQHPEITEVAVIGIPDEKGRTALFLRRHAVEGSNLTEADVIADEAEVGRLRPKRVEFRDELARTATGKLQFKPEPVLGRREKLVN
ncbi:MAG: hypothetical protein R2697_07610 [Ilumatobacteraceae bacterium]